MNSPSPVALVAGSTSGVVAAIGRRLSNEGYWVGVHSRNSAQAGHALANQPGSTIYVQGNLAGDAANVSFVREAIGAT